MVCWSLHVEKVRQMERESNCLTLDGRKKLESTQLFVKIMSLLLPKHFNRPICHSKKEDNKQTTSPKQHLTQQICLRERKTIPSPKFQCGTKPPLLDPHHNKWRQLLIQIPVEVLQRYIRNPPSLKSTEQSVFDSAQVLRISAQSCREAHTSHS